MTTIISTALVLAILIAAIVGLIVEYHRQRARMTAVERARLDEEMRAEKETWHGC